MPTIKEIDTARRLMAAAEIQSVRLVEAHCLYSPGAGPSDGGPLNVRLDSPVQRGSLAKGNGLRALLTHILVAKRGKSRRVLRIEATFELVYSVPPRPRPKADEVNAFCKTNAMFNSWPYWREFVQGTVARMGLPPLTLPFFRVTPVRRRSRSKP